MPLMLRITPRLKLKLRKPIGTLFLPSQKRQLVAALENRFIVAVGDATVLKLSELHLHPHVSVYDLKTRREPLPRKKEEFFRTLHAERIVCVNPAGYITPSLEKAAARCLKNAGPTKLFVIGEEDLATLVFLRLARTGVVCYGQPKKGLVVVPVNADTKEKADALYRDFLPV